MVHISGHHPWNHDLGDDESIPVKEMMCKLRRVFGDIVDAIVDGQYIGGDGMKTWSGSSTYWSGNVEARLDIA